MRKKLDLFEDLPVQGRERTAVADNLRLGEGWLGFVEWLDILR